MGFISLALFTGFLSSLIAKRCHCHWRRCREYLIMDGQKFCFELIDKSVAIAELCSANSLQKTVKYTLGYTLNLSRDKRISRISNSKFKSLKIQVYLSIQKFLRETRFPFAPILIHSIKLDLVCKPSPGSH